jgi:hypothetical protein
MCKLMIRAAEIIAAGIDTYIYICVCVCVCVYIYIYIYDRKTRKKT